LETTQIYFLKALFSFGIQLLLVSSMHAQSADFADIDYARADSVAGLYEGEDLHNLPELVYQLSNPFDTEVEQFRSIYTWVCKNIENDYWYYQKNKKKRNRLRNDSLKLEQWNSYLQPIVFERLVEEQVTVCTGYAYLMQEMAALANIECVIVDGYGRTVETNVDKLGMPNHSWNAVKLNGNWYLCDATWSSGFTEVASERVNYIAEYNDSYFLADPRIFVKNHYPLDSRWILLDNQPSIEEFIEGPIVYKEAYSKQLIPLAPHDLHIKLMQGDSLQFTYETSNEIDPETIVVEINSGINSKFLQVANFSHEGKILSFSTRMHSKGSYALHIKIEEQYLFSYEVEVVRK
jgi:transglutaminase/protease-like cytokinesis protein 3